MENSYASMFAAMEIIREELLKHDWLYDCFKASVLSVLKKSPLIIGNDNDCVDLFAEAILDRLIGCMTSGTDSDSCIAEVKEHIPDHQPEKELVNHPEHYNIPGRKECIEEMMDIWGAQAVALWCEMTAYKYSYRVGHKDPENLEQGKIKWYMDKCQEIKDGIQEKKLNTQSSKKIKNCENEALDSAIKSLTDIFVDLGILELIR